MGIHANKGGEVLLILGGSKTFIDFILIVEYNLYAFLHICFILSQHN